MRLTAQKPEYQALQGDTLGAQLRRCRRELGLTREQAAAQLGASWKTLMWWERNEREPFVSAYPAIIAFLGYEPWPEPCTLADSLRTERRRRGIEVRAAAKLAAVDEGTWRRWEREEWKPTSLTLSALDQFFGFAVGKTFPNDVR